MSADHPTQNEPPGWRKELPDEVQTAQGNEVSSSASRSRRTDAKLPHVGAGDGLTELLDPCGGAAGGLPEPQELVRGAEKTEMVKQGTGQEGAGDGTIYGKVGRYELRKRIGIGAFGEVWVANDPMLRRPVAVKIPRVVKLREAPWLPMAFWREAVVAARAADRGCGVPVYDFGWDGDMPFIVMQLMEGNFLDLLRQGPLPMRRVCRLVLAVARRLHRAHLSGIVHCDLKPSNILFHHTGAVYPSDFSSSTDMASVAAPIEAIIGTVPYMAPEQLRGETFSYDCRTDCYGLGVICYELLTGRKPFEGTREEVLKKVMLRQYPPLRELVPDAPDELVSLIDSAISPHKSGRPQDVREFGMRIKRVLHQLK